MSSNPRRAKFSICDEQVDTNRWSFFQVHLIDIFLQRGAIERMGQLLTNNGNSNNSNSNNNGVMSLTDGDFLLYLFLNHFAPLMRRDVVDEIVNQHGLMNQIVIWAESFELKGIILAQESNGLVNSIGKTMITFFQKYTDTDIWKEGYLTVMRHIGVKFLKSEQLHKRLHGIRILDESIRQSKSAKMQTDKNKGWSQKSKSKYRKSRDNNRTNQNQSQNNKNQDNSIIGNLLSKTKLIELIFDETKIHENVIKEFAHSDILREMIKNDKLNQETVKIIWDASLHRFSDILNEFYKIFETIARNNVGSNEQTYVLPYCWELMEQHFKSRVKTITPEDVQFIQRFTNNCVMNLKQWNESVKRNNHNNKNRQQQQQQRNLKQMNLFGFEFLFDTCLNMELAINNRQVLVNAVISLLKSLKTDIVSNEDYWQHVLSECRDCLKNAPQNGRVYQTCDLRFVYQFVNELCGYSTSAERAKNWSSQKNKFLRHVSHFENNNENKNENINEKDSMHKVIVEEIKSWYEMYVPVMCNKYRQRGDSCWKREFNEQFEKSLLIRLQFIVEIALLDGNSENKLTSDDIHVLFNLVGVSSHGARDVDVTGQFLRILQKWLKENAPGAVTQASRPSRGLNVQSSNQQQLQRRNWSNQNRNMVRRTIRESMFRDVSSVAAVFEMFLQATPEVDACADITIDEFDCWKQYFFAQFSQHVKRENKKSRIYKIVDIDPYHNDLNSICEAFQLNKLVNVLRNNTNLMDYVVINEISEFTINVFQGYKYNDFNDEWDADLDGICRVVNGMMSQVSNFESLLKLDDDNKQTEELAKVVRCAFFVKRLLELQIGIPFYDMAKHKEITESKAPIKMNIDVVRQNHRNQRTIIFSSRDRSFPLTFPPNCTLEAVKEQILGDMRKLNNSNQSQSSGKSKQRRNNRVHISDKEEMVLVVELFGKRTYLSTRHCRNITVRDMSVSTSMPGSRSNCVDCITAELVPSGESDSYFDIGDVICNRYFDQIHALMCDENYHTAALLGFQILSMANIPKKYAHCLASKSSKKSEIFGKGEGTMLELLYLINCLIDTIGPKAQSSNKRKILENCHHNVFDQLFEKVLGCLEIGTPAPRILLTLAWLHNSFADLLNCNVPVEYFENRKSGRYRKRKKGTKSFSLEESNFDQASTTSENSDIISENGQHSENEHKHENTHKREYTIAQSRRDNHRTIKLFERYLKKDVGRLVEMECDWLYHLGNMVQLNKLCSSIYYFDHVWDPVVCLLYCIHYLFFFFFSF